MTALPVVTDPALAAVPGVRHAFFTRKGGVSTGLYASLNVGIGSDDDPEAVLENRRRAQAHLGGTALVTAYQIHSATVAVAEGPWPGQRPQADAVVTTTAGVVCGVLSADCAPVLLADAKAGVVAAAHAGWRGALGGVVRATVERMTELGALPERITAAVGPCIGPESYEVGADFLAAFERDAPEAAPFFRPGASTNKRLFDLPGFVLDRLAREGVTRAGWVGRDTCAEADDFYSNRRALLLGEPDYGRLLSAIVLAEGGVDDGKLLMSKPVAIDGPHSWARIALAVAACASALIGLVALGSDSVLGGVMLAWGALLAIAAALTWRPRWRIRGEILVMSRLWRRPARTVGLAELARIERVAGWSKATGGPTARYELVLRSDERIPLGTEPLHGTHYPQARMRAASEFEGISARALARAAALAIVDVG